MRNEAILFCILLLLLVTFKVLSVIQTCSSCIENLGLEWCQKREHDLNSSIYSRCLIDKELTNEWEKWCGQENIYFPSNEVDVIEDEPFTDPQTPDNDREKIIQIKPQLVTMKLAPDKREILNVRFKYVRGYSLELYYLMDLSKSMGEDKETLTQLADDLATELKKLTPNLKLGFGSFLDKVMLPFVNTHSTWLENVCREEGTKTCRAPYGYQNILSLTNDTEQFIKSVRKAKLSTNLDDPEGGLDALLQAMVCDDIGWKTTATRHLIVYVSGSAFKYAGDGKLAGLTKENDMKCHLDGEGMYEYSSIQDYPSVSQIENVSKEKRMYVIFAVKENVLPFYEALSKLIAQSEASRLQEDSSNIIDIITTIYEDISKTLILTDDSYKYPDIAVSYASKCGEGQPWREGSSQCEDVDINEEIEFRISFKLAKCLPKDQVSTIRISPQGLEDELIVQISSNCECQCEEASHSIEKAERCSFRGNFACGVCVCDDGYSGEFCECKETSSRTTKREKCQRPDDQTERDCSGHGVCKCGICECQTGVNGNPNWMYQGSFCECSNFDCPKTSGSLCSNHGKCECSRCVCDRGWIGESCGCDTRKDNCFYRVNNKVCSGHGTCVCNQCRCDVLENDKSKRYYGKYCEDCESCEGRCSSYNNCIKCMVYNTGPLQENCEKQCSYLEIIEDQQSEGQEKRCSYKDDNGCLVIFSYDPSVEDVIYLQKEPNCSENIQFYVVIGSMVGLILLIGILILIIWKCWVTIKDKREYQKFLKEYEQATFGNEMNPIYRDPVTRITNPLRDDE